MASFYIFIIIVWVIGCIGGYYVRGIGYKGIKTPRWSQQLANVVFATRYIIMMFVIVVVVVLGYYLNQNRGWTGKDTIQVCTALLILLTFFFAALNYEFTSSKARRDYESARNLLTYNTACEWHKNPMSQYQKDSISKENIFIATTPFRTIENFRDFIQLDEHRDFKQSLKCILNHFECVAIGCNKGMIDTEFIKNFYEMIFKIYYRDYYAYITSERTRQSSPTMWSEFTNLVEGWDPDFKARVENGEEASLIINAK